MLGLPGEQLGEIKYITVSDDEQGRGLRVKFSQTYLNVTHLVVTCRNLSGIEQEDYVQAGFLEVLYLLPGGQVEPIQYSVQFESQVYSLPTDLLYGYPFKLAFTPRRWLNQVSVEISYIPGSIQKDQFHLIDASTTAQELTVPTGARELTVYSLGVPSEGYYVGGYQLQPSERYERQFITSPKVLVFPTETGKHRVSWVGPGIVPALASSPPAPVTPSTPPDPPADSPGSIDWIALEALWNNAGDNTNEVYSNGQLTLTVDPQTLADNGLDPQAARYDLLAANARYELSWTVSAVSGPVAIGVMDTDYAEWAYDDTGNNPIFQVVSAPMSGSFIFTTIAGTESIGVEFSATGQTITFTELIARPL
ncbi:MAG: hypothetical protein AAFR24_06655 [Cyanobacteria bacterium J06627_3]